MRSMIIWQNLTKKTIKKKKKEKKRKRKIVQKLHTSYTKVAEINFFHAVLL